MIDSDAPDSFDTTIIPPLDEVDMVPEPAASQPSRTHSTASQAASSQGSIGDFIARADDDHVLKRTPFRPSVPPRFEEPQLRMPTVETQSNPRRRRPGPREEQRGHVHFTEERHPKDTWLSAAGNAGGDFVLETAKFAIDIVVNAIKWTKKPLSILLALYMLLGLWTVVSNMVTRSVLVSLQPLCRVPGAGLLNMPFCERWRADPPPFSSDATDPSRVEFDDLMGVQSQFEQVLERSVDGVGLPLEMRRSETSVRDLRTLVRYSELPHKDELLQELDGFVQVAGQAARDLQYFNTHVGSAVDAVISINRWTARYIDELAETQRELTGGLVSSASGSVLSILPAPLDTWTAWALSPFQPALTFDERLLVERYVENTAMVSERISTLIVEAQALLGVLLRAEDYLDGMHDVVTRQNAKVREQKNDVLANIWTHFGANQRELGSYREQLYLLQRVGGQRRSAVDHVKNLIYDLEKMQAELGDLRDKVAAPGAIAGVVGDGSARGGAGGWRVRGLPLSVHIETINGGVERLEDARRRLRGQEDDKVREVLARARAGKPVEEMVREIAG